MSDELVVKVWRHYPGKGSDLAIFQAIAEAANEQGTLHIAQAVLAAAARITVKSAYPAIQRLRRDRWIVASPILGRGRCLSYAINIPKLERSVRLDRDPNIPKSEAILAAEKAYKRRTRIWGVPVE